jgi:polyisoprenoid-binding protein YceI
MKNISSILGIFFLCWFNFNGILLAQDSYKFINSGNADIKVLGTSNLHNWTMEAKGISCSANFNFLPGTSDQLQSLSELNLSVPVQNLKSGESLMDSRAYTALKSEKFNSIVFVMTSASIISLQKNHFQIKGLGNLTIAGVTRVVNMLVDCSVNPDGTITCNSSQKLKMTDFQIKPPVFMMGVLKTGDELTIDLTCVLNK